MSLNSQDDKSSNQEILEFQQEKSDLTNTADKSEFALDTQTISIIEEGCKRFPIIVEGFYNNLL